MTMMDIKKRSKKLPIGIQTFRIIREDNYYYVDKTGFALQLIEQGKYYFLSRPRRFGKSLFIDTLAELFAGSQELFYGLYAENHWDWSQKSPVIRISFGGGIVTNQNEFNLKTQEQLHINQQELGINCSQKNIAAGFAELIRATHKATGKRVVVLIDEYDKPILDNLEQLETATKMQLPFIIHLIYYYCLKIASFYLTGLKQARPLFWSNYSANADFLLRI